MAGGLLAMVVGGGALLGRQQAEQAWTETEEAARAARQVAAPTPRWLDEPASTPAAAPPAAPTATRPAPATATRPPSTPTPSAPPQVVAEQTIQPARSEDVVGVAPPEAPPAEVPQPDEPPADVPSAEAPQADRPPADVPPVEPTPGADPRASADAVEILGSEFRFLDPPEPGAQAIIGIQVRNHADLPTGPLRLTLSTRWLSGWRILAADPPVLADRLRDGARRTFDFPGLDGDAEGTFELHLVATDDAVDPPEIVLALAPGEGSPRDSEAGPSPTEGAEIGRARPETVAPRPRPGPARALAIPRLGLRAAVVPTTWEPPSFVVGQLRQTANLSEGNTVLIGHLNGLAGNIFARLDELEPGDEIIAVSRGLEYRFVVSETMALPGDDSVPIQPTDEPRLTLMTCIGDWDPIGLDYSHRLWIVAEPEELAATTLSGETPGPLSRLLGLAPALTLLPPADLGPPPKLAAPDPAGAEEAAAPPEPLALILQPTDGARVGGQVVVRGRLAEDADPAQPLWLVVRAEIAGSRWYPHRAPLSVSRDGTWEASLEIGGAPGIRHTIVVAPMDAATDARLRRQVAQRPGEPLPILPDAFEAGARIVVERR